ncbi:MAG: hypothetical protein KatS3mg017_0107 [Fimbriimonadales bacterium]|nr:MAG: hypothetical protein KatS3mg017_0107 [Fimbriimonadales bacterium]GIV09844.1 MAG: hypothetical protein KatS3mg019_1935 [Fimbriimonadales bacterium]
MLVLILGIATGIDPLLCTVRGLIGGMVGWIAGALWAYVMSQLLPPDERSAPTAEASPPTKTTQAPETDSENEATAA